MTAIASALPLLLFATLKAQAVSVYTYTYTGSPLTQIIGSDVSASSVYLGRSVSISFTLPFFLPPNLVAANLPNLISDWQSAHLSDLPSDWWQPHPEELSWQAGNGLDLLTDQNPNGTTLRAGDLYTDSTGRLIAWNIFASQLTAMSFAILIATSNGGDYTTPNYAAFNDGSTTIGASNPIQGVWSVVSDQAPEPSSFGSECAGIVCFAVLARLACRGVREVRLCVALPSGCHTKH